MRDIQGTKCHNESNNVDREAPWLKQHKNDIMSEKCRQNGIQYGQNDKGKITLWVKNTTQLARFLK